MLPREHPNNILADVMAQLNWKNLRVAETEKYAHVTYFFNGGNEKPYPGEEPRDGAVSEGRHLRSEAGDERARHHRGGGESHRAAASFDVIVMNFANADMVGHSGKMAPTVRAVEAVDAGLGQIYAALSAAADRWMITADHGNAETMIDPVTKGPHTYHTTNPVPFILVDDGASAALQRRAAGYLADGVRLPGRKAAQGNDGEGSQNDLNRSDFQRLAP